MASELPLARFLFDELNHAVTPGGHRVTVYWDAHRLVKVRLSHPLPPPSLAPSRKRLGAQRQRNGGGCGQGPMVASSQRSWRSSAESRQPAKSVRAESALRSLLRRAGSALQGEDWEEGFANGLLHSLCFFPLLSYGATAPLAAIPDGGAEAARQAGWDEKPAGRARLTGDEGDAEDNLLKELLIAVSLLDQHGAGGDGWPAEGRSESAEEPGDDGGEEAGAGASGGNEAAEEVAHLQARPPTAGTGLHGREGRLEWRENVDKSCEDTENPCQNPGKRALDARGHFLPACRYQFVAVSAEVTRLTMALQLAPN